MTDVQANIGIGVDTTQALASIRQLQREISVFHSLMAKGGATANASSKNYQQNLIRSVNATGKFSAGMARISSSTESFTNSLEKNKLSMGQYFRYAGGASKSFGRMFSKEFNTISRVATERVKDLQTQYVGMGRDASGALQAIKVRPLSLDMNNLGTKVQLAAQKQQIFNQVLRQGSTNLLNFGKNTQWAGRQLMVGFTLPLTLFGVLAVKEFKKIEEQAVKFKRVYGDMFTSSTETKQALDGIRELADEFTKYGLAVEKTIGLAAKAAQMGNMGADLTAQVTQATRLAVLGGIEQEDALDTTISLTNAFGIAAEDLGEKIEFLNAAENQTILAIEDFNTAIPLSGSVVKQLGGDVEDLAVLLTAMREGGINAAKAGNALKSSLARLIAPSRNAKETLSGFGIDVVSLVDDNAGNLMGTINALGKSLNELDPLSRAKSIEALFGKFQFARMSVLFSNIGREGSQASKVLGLAANSAAELAILAERELARVEDSPAFKLDKQLEKLQSALAPIGAEFVKAILPIMEFGTKILKAFNNMGEGGKNFIVILTAIAGVIAPAALMAFGLVANGIANLIKFFQFLGNAFGMLSGRSALLGGQTEYMTQQQIEAASVAASLGQSHSRLTQVFTTEASAVAALVTQYRAAISQQRQLSTGMTARGVARGPANAAAPRKYATGGIVSGPGTGTSDSILSMLSNGEAVIPAAEVRKNPKFIEQLISGNIPGYAKGRNAESLGTIFGGKGDVRTLAPSAVFAPGNKSAAGTDMDWWGKGGAAPAASVEGSLKGAMLDNSGQKVTKSGLASLDKINPVVDEFTAIFQRAAGSTKSFAEMSEQAFPELLATVDRWEAAGSLNAQEAEDLRLSTTQTFGPDQEGLRRVPRVDVKKDTDTGEVFVGRNSNSTEGTRFASKQQNATKAARARRGLDPNIPEGFQWAHARDAKIEKGVMVPPQASKNVPADVAAVMEKRMATGEKFKKGQRIEVPGAELEADMNKVGRDAGQSLVDGTEDALQISSPSKRMWQVGKDGAKGLINGAKETFKKLKGKTLQVGKGVGKHVENSPRAQRAADYLSGRDLDAKKAAKASSQSNTMAAEAAEDSTEATNNLVKTTEEKAKEDKAVLKESKRQNRQNRAGKALGALGTATMVAGMATQVDGKVGEVAQKIVGPMAALSGIAPMLMALPAPIAALVAVIGLGVAAFVMYNAGLKKARKESLALADAMGSGKKAVQALAEFSGKATSSEIMGKQKESKQTLLAVQPGKKSFGAHFFDSESGQAMVENVKTSLAAAGTDKTINDIYLQLGNSVASGALSLIEAQSIAQALAGQFDDMSLAIGVNGKLLNLVTGGGVDALTEPITIEARTKLVEDTFTNLDDILNEKAPSYLGTLAAQGQENLDMILGDVSPDDFDNFFSYATAAHANAVKSVFTGNFWKNIGASASAVSNYTANKEMIELTARQVVALRDALESTETQIDSITLGYQDKINKALGQGDVDAAAQLQGQLERTLIPFLETRQRAFDLAATKIAEGSGEFAKSLRESLSLVFEGTDLERATSLFKQIKQIGLTGPKEKMLQYQLTTGTFTLSQIESIIQDFEDMPDVIDKIVEIGIRTPDATEVMSIVSAVKNNPALQGGIVDIFNTENITDFNLALESFRAARKVGAIVPFEDEDVFIKLMYENPEAMDQINADLNTLEQRSAAGPITNEFAIDLIGEDAFAALAFMWDELEDGDKKTALYTVITSLGVKYKDPMAGYIYGGGTVGPEDLNSTAARNAEIAVNSTTFLPSNEEGDDDDNVDSGGAEKSLDSLLTKLRDLRKATIDMKKGWEGMREVLAKTFAGDGKGFDVFSGLSNQIRKMGVGESLIEMIVGMDPDEYAKRKDELFTFDKAGNIVSTTAALKNMSSAFNSIAIGEYLNSQQSFIQNTKNQFTAMNTLTANGMSLADAYEAVQNEALAAAIAMGATKAEIDEIIYITGLMKEQQDRKEAQEKRISVSKNVKDANQEFKTQVDLLRKLAKAQGQYTDAQIEALMSDKDLQTIFLDPKMDQKALENALRNAEQKANLDVQLNLLTTTGQENEMSKYAAEVSDYFSKNESAISLDFELATADDNKILTDAQGQIADIQYQLDDYNAEIEQISWLEDDINEKYDKRSEALDEIANTNDRISQQQKAQLGIADALSKGDISAAARAVQDLKEQNADNYKEDQSTMLDRAREAELGALRGPGGLTKKELEETITELERQVFLIEEQSMEPAQERIRLAEVTKNLAIERLELEGKSRMEWDQISSSTALAAMSLEDMVLAAKKMAALSEFIKTGNKGATWEELFPKPEAAVAPARKPSSSRGGGGSSAGTVNTDTDGDVTKSGTDPNEALNKLHIARSKSLAAAKKAAAAAAAAYAENARDNNRLLFHRVNATLPNMHGPMSRSGGGGVKGYSMGGGVKGYAAGGFSMGSDVIQARLTPGEFVVRKRAVQNFGMDNLESINNGSYANGSVYTYNLAVNVNSDSDPSRIARAVMTQIKQVDSQRIRTNKL
jgi:TP901 family phage tail tape measure protein